MIMDINEILKERGKRYGVFADHAMITQGLKNIINQYSRRHSAYAADQQEALDMIAHKIGRIICGDPNYSDSWRDIAGYATLVADRLDRGQKQEVDIDSLDSTQTNQLDGSCPSCQDDLPWITDRQPTAADAYASDSGCVVAKDKTIRTCKVIHWHDVKKGQGWLPIKKHATGNGNASKAARPNQADKSTNKQT